jgi:hypothetical protein
MSACAGGGLRPPRGQPAAMPEPGRQIDQEHRRARVGAQPELPERHLGPRRPRTRPQAAGLFGNGLPCDESVEPE